MAAWHYHQLSNIHSVWSPSPGNLLCDRTSGAQVINHYTHPQAAVWHLSSRTVLQRHTLDPTWFITRTKENITKGSIMLCCRQRYPFSMSMAYSYKQNYLIPQQNPVSLQQMDFCKKTYITESQLLIGLLTIYPLAKGIFNGKSKDRLFLSYVLYLVCTTRCIINYV